MNKLYLIGLLVIFTQLCLAQSISRQVISLGGESETANEINVSFTLGQFFINTLESSDMIVTQGFQQPDQKILTSTTFTEFDKESIEIFPIPASEHLTIRLSEAFQDELLIELYKSDGSRMISSVIQAQFQNEVILPLNKINSGYYLLRITDFQNLKRLNQSLIVQK